MYQSSRAEVWCELEVAALLYALEHFKVYLLSSKVTVYTDHQTLVLSFIPYLKSDNRVSDVLSRALVPASGGRRGGTSYVQNKECAEE